MVRTLSFNCNLGARTRSSRGHQSVAFESLAQSSHPLQTSLSSLSSFSESLALVSSSRYQSTKVNVTVIIIINIIVVVIIIIIIIIITLSQPNLVSLARNSPSIVTSSLYQTTPFQSALTLHTNLTLPPSGTVRTSPVVQRQQINHN